MQHAPLPFCDPWPDEEMALPKSPYLRAYFSELAYERFRVRASERKAWVGAQTLQAASKGGVARKKPIQQYEALISNFRASGLSQQVYARSAKISFSTLKYALKKLGSDPAK